MQDQANKAPQQHIVSGDIVKDFATTMSITPRRITVESPARLHLGFVDLNGGLGRKFGSLGLAISDLSTVVSAARSSTFSVDGVETRRAEKYARGVLRALELDEHVALTVERAIPAHAGLGSGTQLALTVASAITAVFGVHREVADLAQLTARGARSGIGIGVFESGGFVIDGGRAAHTVVPPVLARFEFPHDWSVILVGDADHQGLSGSAERAAFDSTPPMTPALAAELCRVTLMGVFPALVEHDFTTFCRSIALIQEVIGCYFGPSQGGQFTSRHVAQVIACLRADYGLTGLGQTSWGPTAFAFVEGREPAESIVLELRKRFNDTAGLRFSVHQGCNHGAVISHSGQRQRSPRAAASMS